MAAKFTSDAEFVGEVLNSPEPVIVDFTADWCPPCKVIAPFLDEIAVELRGRARIIKLDVDANPYTTTQYGVRSMPTLMIFKSGEPISMTVGAAPKARLLEWINSAI
ncbi:MAG: thioredoxin [Bauldia sp.]|nr:thioredoxin [Bauldia sp.]